MHPPSELIGRTSRFWPRRGKRSRDATRHEEARKRAFFISGGNLIGAGTFSLRCATSIGGTLVQVCRPTYDESQRSHHMGQGAPTPGTSVTRLVIFSWSARNIIPRVIFAGKTFLRERQSLRAKSFPATRPRRGPWSQAGMPRARAGENLPQGRKLRRSAFRRGKPLARDLPACGPSHPEPPASRRGTPHGDPWSLRIQGSSPLPGSGAETATSRDQGTRGRDGDHGRPLSSRLPQHSPMPRRLPRGGPLRQDAAKLSPSGKLRRSAFGLFPLTMEPPCGVRQATGRRRGRCRE